MRHRLALEDADRAADGGGGAIVTWVARRRSVGGDAPRVGRRDVWRPAVLRGRVTHEITIRHRAGVTPRRRFRLGARVFDIRAVIDVDEARRFLRCLVEERVP